MIQKAIELLTKLKDMGVTEEMIAETELLSTDLTITKEEKGFLIIRFFQDGCMPICRGIKDIWVDYNDSDDVIDPFPTEKSAMEIIKEITKKDKNE